jgi:hypothetical protein
MHSIGNAIAYLIARFRVESYGGMTFFHVPFPFSNRKVVIMFCFSEKF